MSELTNSQSLMWLILQNLRHDATTFSPTESAPQNFGQELLTGFLNNQTFRDAIKTVAKTMHRDDIIAEVTATPIGKSPRDDMASGLVMAVERNDQEMLVDLIKTPETSILSLTQLEKFWNTDAFISNSDPDIHTHIQADPRYVSLFDQYVAAKEMTGEKVTALREKIVTAHNTASATLDKIPFDGIQMANYNAASGFYEAIRTGNVDVLGYDEVPEKNIFNGLGVTEPVSAEKLTAVTAPLPHIAIQEAKNAEADKKPTIVEVDNDDADTLSRTTTKEITNPAAKPVEIKPDFVATVTPEIVAPQEVATYTVQSGDNLWKIAKNEYGLKSYKDIMKAVDHIAIANGLEKGTDANWIKNGAEIKMPTAEQIKGPTETLDWKALSADPKLGQNAPAVG